MSQPELTRVFLHTWQGGKLLLAPASPAHTGCTARRVARQLPAKSAWWCNFSFHNTKLLHKKSAL